MNQDNTATELDQRFLADTVIFDFLQTQVLDGLWYQDIQASTREHNWVNPTFWRTLGYEPEQIPTGPTPWRTVMHPGDLAVAQLHLEACLQDPNHSYDHLLRCTHQDGSVVWLRGQGLLLRNEQGTPTRLLVALRNITKEKHAAAYAQEIANHYGLILSNQSVYIVKTDTQGNYTYANEIFYERFGYEQDIIGTSSLLSIIEEDRQKCLAMVMRCFEEPEVGHQVILRKLSSDNTIKSNHWELKGILSEQGEVVEILCVGYDVTLLVENLQKSQHLLDITSQQNIRLQNFAYIISHNIRSHSANLTSLVQLLTEAEDEEQHDMFLQMLQTSTEKLAETIVNLSDIVAVNSNVNKPKESRLLKAEIDKTLEALSVLIHQHKITMDVHVPAGLAITVVPAYLDSILLNLISNAVKYRSPHRPAVIRLHTYREGGFTVLEVQDNGLGIDLVKNRAKLFGMYKTFHDNEDARGVGLFITKNQIEAMQGSITVESEVGIGSTFKVSFNENA
ncbi:PAS domain-containing protein [Hymenobacter aerilatus]|uniref:histidine kinase n=1 Tax=Hymenobacter aerilatus TaxID=2932251 RepID=A0A8T9SXX8_9BACT|nr:PAS domain-containing protein [Hymenobacter aerilatus]UOR06928.1 PAS domain-containing protein [Hymenobacter aerilatus]